METHAASQIALWILIGSFFLMGMWITSFGLRHTGMEGQQRGEIMGYIVMGVSIVVVLLVVSRDGFQWIAGCVVVCVTLFVVGAFFGLFALKVLSFPFSLLLKISLHFSYENLSIFMLSP